METLTLPARRFHCNSLEPNRSALFLGSSKSLRFSSPCVIRCGSEEEDGRKCGSCDIDDSGPEISSSSSSDSSENDAGASGTGSPSPWCTGYIVDGMFG